MSLRTFCTIFLLISVCAFPLYFTIAMGIFCVVWFENYYELIPLYFLHDVLYGIPFPHFFHFSYVSTIFAIVLVCVSIFVRKNAFNGQQSGKLHF